MRSCRGLRGGLCAWVAVVALALGAARAGAEGDPRELKAREDFAAGRYQQALDVFAKLYAETLHPTYLRNIGRCYQNMGDADHAIVTFRDYLRKHEAITPEQRAEVEGFIAEMETLKKQRSGVQASSPPSSSLQAQAPPPGSSITPLPAAPEPKGGGAAPEALVTQPAHPTEDSSPVYTRWWFWTIVGAAAVGAGLGIAAATGAFTTTQNADCVTGYTCK